MTPKPSTLCPVFSLNPAQLRQTHTYSEITHRHSESSCLSHLWCNEGEEVSGAEVKGRGLATGAFFTPLVEAELTCSLRPLETDAQ